MQRKRIVLIAVAISLVIILISIILILFVFNGADPFKPLPNSQSNQKSLEVSPKLDPVQPLPVSYNHPAIRGATVNYIFEGNLKEIKGKSPDLELITDMIITGGPKSFITGKNTKYYKETKGVRTPTNVSNLKPGQRIKIAIFHDFHSKSWTLTGVAIVQD